MTASTISLLTFNIGNPSEQRAERQLTWLATRPEQILVLTELEQFSAAEAGRILGVSSVAARVRALRARRRLRALWESKGGRHA